MNEYHNKWHMLIGVCLCLMFVFLIIRARDDDRWSSWGFGDAITLMTMRHWVRDGVFYHYGLEINKGYSKFTKEFDRKELKEHAHGNCGTFVSDVGPDVYYTYYPSGYLFPFYLVSKLGFEKPFWSRSVSIFFSIAAILLMYLLFCQISSPFVAFLGSLFYLCSSMFIGYADSLVEHPVDDFLRFLFMLLTLREAKLSEARAKIRLNIVIWFLAFLVYTQSWDSVLFIFIWLVGLNIISGKKFRIKQWISVATAFIAGFILQFFQNVQYLGYRSAAKHLLVRYWAIAGLPASGPGELTKEILTAVASLFARMVGMANWLEKATWPLMFFVTVVFIAFFLEYRKEGKGASLKGYPSYRLLLLLFVCGSAFPLFLRGAARMTYEGRQMAPFASLLYSSSLL